MLPQAKSITHQHLLAVVNTLLTRMPNTPATIHILDAGCGDGELMRYLHVGLSLLRPDRLFVIHGFDVSDHGVQSEGFLRDAVVRLSREISDVNWGERIFAVTQGQDWSFNDRKYDLIVSNQVLEHVRDKGHFFINVSRKLVDGGFSIHLAPLTSVVPEGHVNIPFAHRFKSFGAMHQYIRFMSVLGIGKFRAANRSSGVELGSYSERHADYLYHWTSYSTEAETIKHVRACYMRADFRFSVEFYTSKIIQVLRLAPRIIYKYRSYGFMDALLVKILRYFSSVTLVTEKKNTY